jgi:hypothetical protein
MLDMFVTNYANERNNYFSQVLQTPQPLFNDVSVEMNLATPSVATVGWGAQFVDAELDGDFDLFVANGHLDEYTGPPEAKQLPQMFENSGRPSFRSIPTASAFFQTESFGRAVATVDWNRDGLPDLCVSRRDAPVALLTNTSKPQGNFVAIELRGVQSSRDAVGAIVEIEAGGKLWTAPLAAGNGFSVSNQRQVMLGLGKQTRDDAKLTIRWPVGEPQVFENLPMDSRWLIIQGDSTLHALPQ